MPLASTTHMSLVEVSPSTVTRLYVLRTFSCSASVSISCVIAQSVVRKDSMVPMFGWIMPLPLQMPPMRHTLPPMVNSTAAVFVFVSVVIMARLAFSEPLSVSWIPGRCCSMHSTGRRWPITPVEATTTSSSSTPSTFAAALAMRRAFSMPSGAQALALPALATIARATPFSRCSIVT